MTSAQAVNVKRAPHENEASTWPDHDCHESLHHVWKNSATTRAVECMICHRVLKFKFKSKWMRLKMLFWDGVS